MNSIGLPADAPQETQLLIAFADLTLFTRTARTMSDAELAEFCQGFYERIVAPVDRAGGRVVKFMGDAALIVFPRALADAGARCLLDLTGSLDRWLTERGVPCRLVVKAHAGTAMMGVFGAGATRQLDIIGSEVNLTARLDSSGFALSVQGFRALSPQTRRLFKKHTPPVTYIPLAQRHD
ncbi:MAG: adenylate/guanylate cyclase domain-containing protein [Candidatus Wallbacteria bacterium]|nr:adenylate/guanylate cyclase domain-containing protein [Candidatus Wallbacteria bacterium]